MKKIVLLGYLIALFCFATNILAHEHLPQGNFLQTCLNCTVQNNVLRCKCQTRFSNWMRTTLKIPPYCNYIQNYDGRLTCTAYKNNPHLSRRDRHHHLYEMSNGPIWNQQDAEHKCPSWCAENQGKWTGQWMTENTHRSICQCKRGHRLLRTW